MSAKYPSLPCPSRAKYEQLSRGELSLEERNAIIQHRESCESCSTLWKDVTGKTGVNPIHTQSNEDSEDQSPSPWEAIAERLYESSPTLEPNVANAAGASSPIQEAAEPPPPRLGPFRILRVLGRGGMGAVFEAEDERLRRRIALKVMLPEVAKRPGMRERFLREAKAAAGLRHDHIVGVYLVDEERGIPFIAMPLLAGESLEQWLRANPGPAPLGHILRWGRQIAEGLHAAHSRGLVHRDIKPANIWLDASSNGRVKILDFGLAQLSRAATDPRLTQSGVLMGTPGYMAPEQARGGVVDPRADLFSLGVLLYRLTTGKLPFDGPDPMSILMSLAMVDPPAPNRLNPEIPSALSELILQLLSKNPDTRFAPAQGVAERLRDLDKGRSRPSQPTVPQVALKKTPQRRSLVYILVGLLVAFLLGVGGIILFWETKHGTVRLEVNDDSIQVALDKGGYLIKGAGKEELRLTPGEHGLHIKRGDFEFDTDKFILNKGETTVLKVELLPGKVKVVQDGATLTEKPLPATPVPPGREPQPAESTDPHRALAIWVLANNGTVHLARKSDFHLTHIDNGDKLPRDPFHLDWVELRLPDDAQVKAFADRTVGKVPVRWLYLQGGNPERTAASIRDVARIPSLTYVGIAGPRLKAADFAPLAQLPELNHFSAGDFPGMGDELLDIVSAFPRLEHLQINNCDVSNRGMPALGKLTRLKKLYLNSPYVTDELTETVVKLHDLNHLTIRGSGLWTGKGTDIWKKLSLGEFVVGNCSFGDEGAMALARIPSLKRLIFEAVPLGDAGLMALGSLPLESLVIRETRVTAEGLKRFQALCPGCKITSDIPMAPEPPNRDNERSLAEWIHNSRLGNLLIRRTGGQEVWVDKNDQLPPGNFEITDVYIECDLGTAHFRDESLVRLASLKHLKRLSLLNAPVTDKGIQDFFSRPQPNLELLRLVRTRVTDEGIAVLKECPQLSIVRLENQPEITDVGLRTLIALPKLRNLCLHECGVTRKGISLLKNLPLETLCHSWIGDEEAATVGTLTQLRRLEITTLKLSGKGLESLKPLSRLEVLWLNEGKLSDGDLTPLEKLTELKELRLITHQFTGKSFKQLAALSNLAILDLRGNPLEDANMAELPANLPIHDLDVSNTPLSDACVPHLARLKLLRRLNLAQTRVSVEGIKKLQQALPFCTIESDQGNFPGKNPE